MTTRAVFYARVSTADQVDGTSLETQRKICETAIKAQGMFLTDQYVDAGASGADQSRPEWRRLLEDAKSGKFEAVFVLDIDRFTRSQIHGLQAMEDLRQLSVALYDAKNPTVDVASIDANLLTSIRLIMAQEERNKTRERTVRGQRARLDAGGWPGGQPCYGWRLEGTHTRQAHPVPDPEERANLRLIQRLIIEERLSLIQVAERLNALGIPSRTKKRWSAAVVQRVITNPALHRGWFIWGAPQGTLDDRRSRKTKADRTGKPLYGAPGKIQLPDPPFTESEQGELTRCLKSKARMGTEASQPVTRLLTSRIFGWCGRHYTGTSIAGKSYDVYRCTGNRIRGDKTKSERCGCPQIHAQKIESRVWSELENLITDPQRLRTLAEQWIGIRQDQAGNETNGELEQLDAQILRLKTALSRAQDDYYLSQGVVADSLKERINQYTEDLEKAIALQQRLVDAAQHEEQLAERILSVSALAERAKQRLAQMPDHDKRELVELMDIQVFISDIANSEPRNLSISGQIDERLLTAAEQNQARIRGLGMKFELAPSE